MVLRFTWTHLAHSRLLLGRCLATMDESRAYLEYRCSGSRHYAIRVLGLDYRESCNLRRVARCLEGLPVLAAAAEEGAIGWSALSAVTRRATPEDEEYWLRMAQTCSMRRLERLLRGAAAGAEESTREADRVELRMHVDPDVAAMFQRAVRSLSHAAGRPLSFGEAVECLCLEHLAGAAFPEEAARARLEEEVRRDVAAEEAAPWAAVAAEEIPCPDNAEVLLVAPAPPHWENPRVQFNEEARFVTPAQRDQLLRRDGYQCSTPGCPHILWLEVHHLVFYCDGGATVPGNMLILCGACHRNVHRGCLCIRGEAPQGLVFKDPGGRRMDRFIFLEPAEWLTLWFCDESGGP